jgi:hypothetical protein
VACPDVSRDRYSDPQVWCEGGVWVEGPVFYMPGEVDGETGLFRDDADGSPGDGPCPARSMEIVNGLVSLL